MENINAWIDKYRPQKISDLIGNETGCQSIIDWLNNFDKERESYFNNLNSDKKKSRKKKIIEEEEDVVNDEINDIDIDDNGNNDANIVASYINPKQSKSKNHSSLLILGNHGVGKTCAVKTILNNMNYECELINMHSIAANKNIDDAINKIITAKNMLNIFDEHNGVINTKKRAIMIDGLESNSTQTEKKFVEKILKLNDESWFFPLIFTASTFHSGIITLVQNNSQIIRFELPTKTDMDLLFVKICTGEKIKFDTNSTIEKVIIHAQYDFRRLFNIMYDLKKTYGKSRLTNVIINDYFETSKKKDTDIDIYKSSIDLILNYQNVDECLRLYNGEKVILPLMIQENYPKCLSLFTNQSDDILELASKISSSIALGDIVENNIYSDQNWDMQDIHCFHSCISPSFNLTNSGIGTTKEYLKFKMKFPQDLNRTSIKQINKRNVINANEYLKDMKISDFLNAAGLTKLLLADKKNDEFNEMFSGYGMKPETILSVLKIDKINVDKTQQQPNIKKIFEK